MPHIRMSSSTVLITVNVERVIASIGIKMSYRPDVSIVRTSTPVEVYIFFVPLPWEYLG